MYIGMGMDMGMDMDMCVCTCTCMCVHVHPADPCMALPAHAQHERATPLITPRRALATLGAGLALGAVVGALRAARGRPTAAAARGGGTLLSYRRRDPA